MKLVTLAGALSVLIGCGEVKTQDVDAPPGDAPPDGCEGPGCVTAEPVEVSVSGTNGSNSTCARMSDGKVFCWGANTKGQLGFAPAPLDTVPPGQVTLPANVTPAGLFVTKSGQSDDIAFACVVDSQTGAACWGSNHAGELARGTVDMIPHPQPLPIEKSPGTPMTGITSFAPGGRHGCLISEGTVHCWGSDDVGCAVTGKADAMGTCTTPMGSIFTRPGAIAGVPPSSLIASGAGGSCAVTSTNDAIVCWGNNKFATAGNPNVTTTGDFPPSAVALNGVANITQIAMGNAHACVVANGRVHCWGQNNAGQIGGTPGTNITSPVEVTPLAGHTHLTAGGFNLCAYTPSDPNGALVCMGINTEGQLGIGTNDLSDHPTPSSVGDLKDIASASIGGNHGCAVARRRNDPAAMPRRVFCWGKNNAGQVVQPASQRVLDPTEVTLPPRP